ncbi:hypothetical protein [Virgibacillus kimchii]
MTNEELQAYRDRFAEILKCEEPIRTNRLTNLMNDLEWTYHIPTLGNPDYEKRHPEVMKLYRAVSVKRKF